MKRTITILLAALILLSLAACGGSKETRIELTEENIETYLTINKEVVSCELRRGNTARDLTNVGSGEAEIAIEIIRQSNVSFENVTIEFELETVGRYLSNPNYGWEFTSGNTRGTADGSRTEISNFKNITITVPYEGNTRVTERLRLVSYNANPVVADELTTFYYKITNISGFAIVR